jgi:ADP-ribose pyrophosphatase YjhB (NUDIX family)
LSGSLPVREYASAGGVVVSPNGKQLLVLVRPKRLGPRGLPEVRLPKGHVKPDESPVEAALREVAEESGVSGLRVVADLGKQRVEFDWRGHHYTRNETCFLMACLMGAIGGMPEGQFRPLWLSWAEAGSRLTYEADREWVRRASQAWSSLRQLRNV